MLLHPIPGSLVWPAAMIVWGPGFISASHRHHCVQLVMALQGALRVRRGPADEWASCGAALVRPDAFHEVDASAGPVLIGFVDAESELGAALRERMRRDIVPLGARQVARWRAALKPPLSEAQVERWVQSQLLHRRRTVRIHPGVKRVLRYLRESLPVAEDFSLGKLAEVSGLSRSRLMHVFTESVGVPIRPYVLWLRLQRAACDLMAGASVTAAAQNAGFSDAAHLTRTFRRMLGTTPSDLALRRRASRGVSMQSVEPVAAQTIQPERYRPRWQPS
ncbi:MAG TPA: AraC family transcriptional regulator [Burkholderiales bacterium]|nr:AraC family transcriptional regulator [Burkholderiales bacterium]